MDEPIVVNGSVVGQLLEPLRVLEAMTQVRATRRGDGGEWRETAPARPTVVGVRRNSI